MRLGTRCFHRQGGWQGALPVDLDSPQTLLLAFGASDFAEDPEPFTTVAAAFPQSLLLGCSTSGEIAGTEVNDASISVAVVHFEHTRLRHASVEVEGPAESAQAGAGLGRQLQGPDLRAVFVLSDGPGSWRVLPGGLVRLAPRGELIASIW